ncbi:hypothetical protein AMEX_G18056 [Astyanax mexicanus]|uniref:Uncharacterized protein n=1 Tax=Astyanax mexicanus TaxID=7994 RepID=A0A8T2L8A1_ASTMX|nr:hypothetical protein AMEX_G18056 [Astyanax mexicanus]
MVSLVMMSTPPNIQRLSLRAAISFLRKAVMMTAAMMTVPSVVWKTVKMTMSLDPQIVAQMKVSAVILFPLLEGKPRPT